MAFKKNTVTDQQLIDFYKQMVFFRRFEEKINIAYTKQKFSGFCHLHIGQEGLCVGVQAALTPKDYVISGYRSHTQAVAKGIPSREVIAELFGKVSGCSRGKGGSMHMFNKEKNFYGGHGIVGAQVPIGVGLAFSHKYKKDGFVCMTYLGDGAVNQGQVYESFNMSALWSLPVIFIIANANLLSNPW